MIDFFKSDIGLLIILIFNLILFLLLIINFIKLNKIKNNSNEFLKKLGNGKNIEDDLNNYMDRVINLEKALSETNSYCNLMDNRIKECLQKVGIVRYSAYRNTGSDLSFAVALLDEKNNGVVFNGIYSREISNIYAKPILDGKSTYTLTDEEKEAVDKAINNGGIKKIR